MIRTKIYWIKEQIEKDKNFTRKIFISRSFGNIVSNELKIRKSINSDKNVYISPTADAVKYFDKFPGLIITATNDEYLPDEKINELVKKYESNIISVRFQH